MPTTDGVSEYSAGPMIGKLVYCERTRIVSSQGVMIRVAEQDAHDLFSAHDQAC